MSAEIVSNQHITALLQGVFSRYPGNGASYVFEGETHSLLTDKQRLGQVLLDQNLRSVNSRYGENNRGKYRQENPGRSFTPVEIISLCDGYTYQSCETGDLNETEAGAIIRAIRERAIRALPGYDDGPWTI